jgi:DNA-binding MarR family transcriptional regulator
MPTATDLDLEQVARLRLAVARVSRRLRTVPAGQGMTSTQLSVLAAVVRDGPVKLGDLATTEDVNPTMLSRIVAKLDSDGLLSRTSDLDDARVAVVCATAAGRKRHQKIRHQRTEALAAVLVDLDPDHVRALSAAVPALEELGSALRDRRA